jgi:membrane fusion protein (multidrug efflux system)
MWIDANFKESQLREVSVGQPVELTSDMYGSAVVYHGWVIGMGAGTGAAFSLLPAQNASGNWIKIVQRLPVRIGLNPDELNQHPLRIGLSMSVTVRVSEPAAALPTVATGQSIIYQTDNEATLTPEFDKSINEIVSKNSPTEGNAVPAPHSISPPGDPTPAVHP